MSRPIAESLSLLSETLGNCKTNLKEKEVADVDNIKISDVDEKIAEIQSGIGSGGFNWIENVTFNGQSINDSIINGGMVMDDPIDFNLTFTPKEDNLGIYFNNAILSVTPNTNLDHTIPGSLEKGTQYEVTGSSMSQNMLVVIFKNTENDLRTLTEQTDSIIEIVF